MKFSRKTRRKKSIKAASERSNHQIIRLALHHIQKRDESQRHQTDLFATPDNVDWIIN